MSPELFRILTRYREYKTVTAHGINCSVDTFIELEKLAAMEETARCLSVIAQRLENIEGNTRPMGTWVSTM